MDMNEVIKSLYKALDEKKAENIKVIDIQGLSTMADYFVVATGSNPNQLNALQDACGHAMHEHNIELKQVEGNRNSTWILLDFGDVIVHLFSREDRLFYDLERIWKDGKEVDVEAL